MRGRLGKYYFIVTAIAALYAVGMGIDISFGDGKYDVYCDFEVAAERAYLETRWGSCRPRIERILSVFGTIYLVLLGCFWLPAGVVILRRRERAARGMVPWSDTLRRLAFPSANARIKGRRPPPDRIADKIERWAAPFSVGYFAVSAFWSFQYAAFPAWVYLLHNAGASYCEYDYTSSTGDFYSSGGWCDIKWNSWLVIWFVIFIITTAQLQIPIMLLGMFCVVRQLSRYWRGRRE